MYNDLDVSMCLDDGVVSHNIWSHSVSTHLLHKTRRLARNSTAAGKTETQMKANPCYRYRTLLQQALSSCKMSCTSSCKCACSNNLIYLRDTLSWILNPFSITNYDRKKYVLRSNVGGNAVPPALIFLWPPATWEGIV